MTFHDCCRRVLSSRTADKYAKTYAEAGLAMTDRQEVQVQASYVVSNLSWWRDEGHGEVRARLKMVASGKF